MKKSKIISVTVIIIIIIAIVIFIIANKNNIAENLAENNSEIDEEESEYEWDYNKLTQEELDEMKAKILADDTERNNAIKAQPYYEKYKIEVDDRQDYIKSIIRKPEVDFDIALAGIVLGNEMPTLENYEELSKQVPTKNGVWIEKNSRKQLLELFNSLTKNAYYIDSEGYLKLVNVENKQNVNQIYKYINKWINGNYRTVFCFTEQYSLMSDSSDKIMFFGFMGDKYWGNSCVTDGRNNIIFLNPEFFDENMTELTEEDKVLDIIQLYFLRYNDW